MTAETFRRAGAGALARVRAFLPETGLVLGVLTALMLLIFGDFLSGRTSPQFDFVGAYNAEAFAWWFDGSFFRPMEWAPYTWGGYPTVASLQNSAWYLPVGAVANLTFFDIHAASVLHVLHVVFASVGVYALGRRWGLGVLPATFGLCAAFFVAGFYSNAQHVDIVRGYAWIPWLLFVLSPAWPWRRWWAVPGAAVVLWQVLVGAYPGIIVATVYAGAVWVLAQQLLMRPRLREFLLPLGVAAASAGLLSAIKYVPVLLIKGVGSPTGADDSAFDWGILGTVFYGYSGANLPTDMSMRPYFVPATAVALLAFVPWSTPRARSLGLVVAAAIVVSLPVFPWFDIVGSLPGAGLSRFRTSDYRPFILFGTILLAMLALARALGPHDGSGPLVPSEDVAHPESGGRGGAARIAAAERRAPALRAPGATALFLAALLLLALALALTRFDRVDWAAPFTLLLGACAGVLGLSRPRSVGSVLPEHRALAVLMIFATVVSGTVWAFGTTRPWRADRLAAEVGTWGQPVDALIAHRLDPANTAGQATLEHRRRPAREPLTEDPMPPIEEQKRYTASYFAGTAAVGGYTNLKGNPGFEAALAAFSDPVRSSAARAFYASPGLGVLRVGSADPALTAITLCADDAEASCGRGFRISPVTSRPGYLRYEVDLAEAAVIDLNETHYPGWSARLCGAQDGDCSDTAVAMGPVGNVAVSIPAGRWTLDLRYSTPGMALGWLAFAAGVALLAIVVLLQVLVWWVRRRRRGSISPPVLQQE